MQDFAIMKSRNICFFACLAFYLLDQAASQSNSSDEVTNTTSGSVYTTTVSLSTPSYGLVDDTTTGSISTTTGSASVTSPKVANATTASISTTTAFPDISGISCNFDQDQCGWTTDVSGSIKWRLKRGATATGSTGPTRDHTTGKGRYIYIEASSATIGDNAIMRYKFKKPINQGCVSLYYHMWGKSMGTLKVTGQDSNGKRKDLWTKTGNRGNKWNQMRVSIPRDLSEILITGVRGASYLSDIAIDDITFEKTPCQDVLSDSVTNNGTINCTFDSGTCGWVQDSSDIENWKALNGPTSSTLTGPARDHTTGKGTYLYIEASSAKKGDTATLRYKFRKPINQGCFSMYYHMYGKKMGTLKVTGQNSNGQRKNLWTRTGPQGDYWFLMHAPIPKDISEILITGVRGASYLSDIAIDDITFEQTSCKNKSYTNINCTFDSDTCGWFQDNLDNFNWIATNGATASSSTGPSDDHTTGHGKYMYIETSSPRHKDDYAGLKYYFDTPAPQGCFSLFYHMYGADIGSLEVRAASVNSPGQTEKTLRSLSGSQDNQWHQIKINTPAEMNKISIIGVVGKGVHGDIAIDDITIVPGSCSYGPAVVSRLVFEARYTETCRILDNTITKEMLVASARRYGNLIKQLCERDCNTTEIVHPEAACENNHLVVRWPTTTTYTPEVQSVSSVQETQITNRIMQESRMLGTFQLIDSTRMPPVIFPVPNANKTPVRVTLEFYCANGKKYNKEAYACE